LEEQEAFLEMPLQNRKQLVDYLEEIHRIKLKEIKDKHPYLVEGCSLPQAVLLEGNLKFKELPEFKTNSLKVAYLEVKQRLMLVILFLEELNLHSQLKVSKIIMNK
jgi:glucosamine 6-phosphate synthetase-like amidotransferase/phosphosugar isomerase protein